MPALARFIGLNHLAYGLGGLFLFKRDASSTPITFVPVYLLLAGTSGFFAWFRPSSSPILVSAAWLLATLSILLFAWTAVETRKMPLTTITSDDEPEYIYQSGPFAYLRHPFYTAYILNFAAAAFATSNGASGFICLFSVASIYYKYAKLEEGKFARSSLAEQYEQYKARTAILIPGVW